MQEGPNRYQLAGLDERMRGFSRPIEITRAGEQYRAQLRYETTSIVAESQPTQDAALLALIQLLHHRGFRQLKSQPSFRDGVYLGSQESWVDYEDPQESAAKGLLARLVEWIMSHSTETGK